MGRPANKKTVKLDRQRKQRAERWVRREMEKVAYRWWLESDEGYLPSNPPERIPNGNQEATTATPGTKTTGPTPPPTKKRKPKGRRRTQKP